MNLLFRNSLFVASGVGLLFSVVGCGSSHSTITGKVTLDDRPLARATLSFTTADGDTVGFATTDEQGNYHLALGPTPGGTPTGTYTVRITTFQPGISQIDEPIPMIKERVPAKYNENTELTADVTQGENIVDFELDSQGPIVQPRGDFSDY